MPRATIATTKPMNKAMIQPPPPEPLPAPPSACPLTGAGKASPSIRPASVAVAALMPPV
ncbi:hypothetical protein CFBP6762_01687 [Xanthomonas arboricola pv. fragariae]|nr:hypothetical protein CFBP6762_01687 [Xanthomonas arboricola pv. fragariae]